LRPILTTVDPVAFLLRQIVSPADTGIEVVTLVPAGKEPETFTPSPGAVGQLAECSCFFRLGLPCEDSLMPRLASLDSKMKAVDLREFIPEPLKSENSDPHLWMSPAAVRGAVQGIVPILTAQYPEHETLIARNAEQLSARLEQLEQETAARLENLPNRTIYVFHPAYGYFCRQFNLKQEAMEEGGHDPSPKDLAGWIRRISDEGIRTIIAQPEFGDAQVRAVAESVQVNIEIHSPLEPDYFKNLRRLTDLITDSVPKTESP